MPYITVPDDGIVTIIRISSADPSGEKLAKTLFELSRTTDMTMHFDPEIHTLEAIEAGLDGHRPLALTAEVDEADIPTDQYFRDAWTWEE